MKNDRCFNSHQIMVKMKEFLVDKFETIINNFNE